MKLVTYTTKRQKELVNSRPEVTTLKRFVAAVYNVALDTVEDEPVHLKSNRKTIHSHSTRQVFKTLLANCVIPWTMGRIV